MTKALTSFDIKFGMDLITQRISQHLSTAVKDYPSMMIPAEKEMLASVVEYFYSGDGIIIDAGVFLGASTLSLVEGLKRKGITSRKNGEKPIQSFDMAVCDIHMANAINYVYKTDLQPGDSFAEQLRKNLSHVHEIVDLHIGDIVETSRFVDCPIEILFNDCSKSAEIDNFIVRHLFPQLVPGRSVLIQQDFFHE